MSVIDVEYLLREVSPESPCGEDPEYWPELAEIELAAKGRPDQQIGDEVSEGVEPDWSAVRSNSIELFSRTKDLRITVFLVKALARTEGFPGLVDGLALLLGVLERYWEPCHPVLDPEDDNDPTMRINTIASLAASDFTLELRRVPLVSHPLLGNISLRDIDIATGELSAPEGEDAATIGSVDAAFSEADLETLQATAEAVQHCDGMLSKVEERLTDCVGLDHTANLDALSEVLGVAHNQLARRLAERGVGEAPVEGESAEAPVAGAAPTPPGDISSREDVCRMLDKACDYFSRHEPSSPVPYVLQRAKRLAQMDFMEIMRDMAPSGVSQVEQITGSQEE